MKAFTNTLQTKTEALASIRAHKAADQLIKGQYWEEGKGCAVGCQYHAFKNDNDYDFHIIAERVHGIPQQLAYLEDRIFENLPNELAMQWPERFLSAIPEGADLSKVIPSLMVWLMTDKNNGVIRFLKSGSDQEKIITAVSALYARRVNGETVSNEEWADAANIARHHRISAWGLWSAARERYLAARRQLLSTRTPAAEAAAAAAAVAEVAAVAEAAAEAEAVAVAEAAAEAAAVAAAVAWDRYYAVRDKALENAYIKISDKVIDLVKQAPVA